MEENKDNSLVLSKVNSLDEIDIFSENGLVLAEKLMEKIVRSSTSSLKSIPDGIAMLIKARDLNLTFSACLENIHVIDGKTGINIHLIKALLLRGGVYWTLEKDYKPLYEYTDGFNIYLDDNLPEYCKRVSSKEVADSLNEKALAENNFDIVYVYPIQWYQVPNGDKLRETQLTQQHKKALSIQHANVIIKEGGIPVFRIPNQPIDYVYEYKFERKVNNRLMTSIGRFSYSDAMKAKLFEKNTYKLYPKVLISHRAFTLGAREIASDILNGMMEITELKIVSGKDIEPKDIASDETDYTEFEEVSQ